jgi:MFS transporter, DHA2 family, multidrug resistance protein
MYASRKQVDLLMSFRAATLLRVWQYVPVAFLFFLLTLAGYVGLPAEKTNAAAGLMNFIRNIGQSVGTSVVTTLIARRSQYHQSVLAEYTDSGRFHASITGLAMRLTHSGLSMHTAQRQALGRLYGLVQAQASVLSYVDAYWLLSVISAIMFLGSFFLKRNELGESGNVSVHCSTKVRSPRIGSASGGPEDDTGMVHSIYRMKGEERWRRLQDSALTLRFMIC